MEDYTKYKWFYTSSGKLVVGGKSASQNDELLRMLKHSKNDFITAHTSEPGSPFSIILEDVSKVTDQDIKECATFTACFSRAWKLGIKKASVDIFTLSQVYKLDNMKTGTWGVKGKIKKITCDLMLLLVVQKKTLRAIPPMSVKSKEKIFLQIVPGTLDKKDMLPKLQIELHEQFSNEELLSALPSGGLKILR